MSKLRREKQTNSIYKPIYVFLFSILPLCYFLYNYGSNVIFYFDQVEGVGTVIDITKKGEIEFSYMHKGSNEKVELITNSYKKDKLTQIDKKRELDILYSNHIPEMVVIKNIEPKPDFIISLFLILIWTIPLLFYKDIRI